MKIHNKFRNLWYHVPAEDVTHEMRRRAKAVNFGIVYGISPFSLAQDIGVAQWEAKAYMDAYFATFPGVRQYMTDIVEKAKADGYVETFLHRRRALPELTSSNHNLRSFGERVALNMELKFPTREQLRRVYATDLTHSFLPVELKPLYIIEEMWADKKYQPLCLFDGDKAVGECFLWRGNPGWALLDYLCVSPGRRNAGLGSFLLHQLHLVLPDTVILGEVEAPEHARDPVMKGSFKATTSTSE